jgi:hypothetical protein
MAEWSFIVKGVGSNHAPREDLMCMFLISVLSYSMVQLLLHHGMPVEDGATQLPASPAVVV